LQRVDEDTHSDLPRVSSEAPCLSDQVQMTLMKGAHGGNENNRGRRPLPPMSKFRYGVQERHVRISGRASQRCQIR
jgi:hypothetical protein